jgi:RTA1 like protein
MVGLALQVAIIGIFMILYADYLVRYFRSDKTKILVLREKLFFFFLTFAVGMILGRSCYRCYELSQGYRDSELITDEALFIGLEGV